MTKKRPAHVGKPPPGLSAVDELFALTYLTNGSNATAAYKAAHPKVNSENAAAVEGYRLLRKPKIAAFLETEREARFARLRMEGDEALALISEDARADIRQLFNEKDELKPAKDWPESIARSVRSVKPGPFGPTITLNDSLKARELMAIAAGKLRSGVVGELFDHVAYLAGLTPASTKKE